MQVILLERVGKLGKMGDIVMVKPGYARNFLIPQNKAKRATKDNIAYFEQERERLEIQNKETKQVAETFKEKVASLEAVVIRTSSEKGHLYGSVTTRDISAACKEQGFDIPRTQINLITPIKNLGIFEVIVALHPEVETRILVNVARSKEEAVTQKQLFLNAKQENNKQDTSSEKVIKENATASHEENDLSEEA